MNDVKKGLVLKKETFGTLEIVGGAEPWTERTGSGARSFTKTVGYIYNLASTTISGNLKVYVRDRNQLLLSGLEEVELIEPTAKISTIIANNNSQQDVKFYATGIKVKN